MLFVDAKPKEIENQYQLMVGEITRINSKRQDKNKAFFIYILDIYGAYCLDIKQLDNQT